jgi:erythromycin esterase-like protein
MAVAVRALPPGVEERVLQVAANSHLLLFGELHGTREVPAIVAALLPKLVERGYRGLGLEVPRDQQAPLTAWADGLIEQPPPFFLRPSRDGRGNTQVLDMVKAARTLDLQLVCFDQAPDQTAQQWAERDDFMARNLLEGWSRLPAGAKVVGICGSLHARLAPEQGVARLLRKAVSGGQQLWPSLAGWVRQHQPALVAGAVEVRFAAGGYFNMGEKTIYARPGTRTEAWVAPADPSYTLALWLPRATPATFLSPPG